MAIPPPPRAGRGHRPAPSHLVPLSSGSAPKIQTDYDSIKIIGNGSYGSAVLCSRRNDDRLVVVKVLKLKATNQERAHNEIRILRQLVHVNIVRYFDHWQEGDRLFISMEYAEDGDMRGAITCQRRRGRLFPEPLVLLWMIQLTSALYYVHSMRVLHRDIKSNNIFLSEKGRMIKVGDFGISKQLDESTEFARTIIGTPYYLSPEIVDGRKYNSKSDIWAVGVLLYEILTFEYPYQAATQQELFSQIRSGKRSRNPSGFSKELVGLLDLLLEPDRKKRPSARHLLRMPVLRGAVGVSPATATQPQVAQPSSVPQAPASRERRGLRSPLPPARGTPAPGPPPPSRGIGPEAECPVCSKKFPVGDIQRHANMCMERRGKTRNHPKVSPRDMPKVSPRDMRSPRDVPSPPASTPPRVKPLRREERPPPRRASGASGAPATRRRSPTSSSGTSRRSPTSSRGVGRPNVPKKPVPNTKAPASVSAVRSPAKAAAPAHAPPPPPPSPPPPLPPPPSPASSPTTVPTQLPPPPPVHERRSPTPGRGGYVSRGVSPPVSCVTARSQATESTHEDAKSSKAPSQELEDAKSSKAPSQELAEGSKLTRRGGSALSSSASGSPRLPHRLPAVEVRPSAFVPRQDANLRAGGAAWWSPLMKHDNPVPLRPKDPLRSESHKDPVAVPPVLLKPACGVTGGGRRGGYRGTKDAKEEILSRLRGGAPPLAPAVVAPQGAVEKLKTVLVVQSPRRALCSPPRRGPTVAYPPPAPEDLPPVRGRPGRRQPSPPSSPMSLSVDVDASGTSLCSLTFSELPSSSGLNAVRAGKARWAWVGAYIPPAEGSVRGRRGAFLLFALLRKTRCLGSSIPVLGFVAADVKPAAIRTPTRAVQGVSITPSPHSSEVSACSPVQPVELHRALCTPDIIEVDGDECSELARSLAETLREVDSLGSDDDDGDFDDQMPQMLSLLSCVQFDGFKAGKLQVVGISESDSLSTQAEGLGKVLEEELGFDTFIGLYRMLGAQSDGEPRLAQGNRLLRAKRALGGTRVHFLHLMVQLIQFTTNFHKEQHVAMP
eukprot:Hpha_TRINITY_DN15774_c3_g1::TRINITY_DN15774_c3_g1_i1::g.40593::m.40593/K08857/NEK1_4_5; NIMA (never in mitosis gene a)-related kinase 1/4/5